jgi:predicted dehydrogenase
MSTIRLGFVGAGNMGQAAHLQHYACLPGCEIAALAELRPNLRSAVAARLGIRGVYASHREMLTAERLDAIVAIQPFGLHGGLVPELLAYGRPVLTEKPIARSSESAEAICAAESRHAGARLWVAYHKRSDPATMWVAERMRRLASSGELGRLRYIRCTMPPGDWISGGFDHLVRAQDGPWQDDVAWDEAPRGFNVEEARSHEAFVNYYIHQVNLLRHLLGEDYQVTYADPAGVVLHARSASGVPAVLEMAPWSNTTGWQESVQICYEKGWIRLELPAPLAESRSGTVTVCEDRGGGTGASFFSPILPATGAMRSQALNFIKAVRGEAHPLCCARDAAKDIAIADAYIAMLARRQSAAAAGA